MLPEIKEELGVALCVSKFFIWLLIKCPKDVRSCIGGILVRYLVVKHVQVHICAHLGHKKHFLMIRTIITFDINYLVILNLKDYFFYL